MPITGLPPDSLTVDHSNVYWYNKTEEILYYIDKQTGVIFTKPMADVLDIVAYGIHLQPLPCKSQGRIQSGDKGALDDF